MIVFFFIYSLSKVFFLVVIMDFFFLMYFIMVSSVMFFFCLVFKLFFSILYFMYVLLVLVEFMFSSFWFVVGSWFVLVMGWSFVVSDVIWLLFVFLLF